MLYEWPAVLDEGDKEQILRIINAVAATQGTNGIPRPLTPDEGAAYMDAVAASVARGDSYQLCARRECDGSIVAIATVEPVKLNPARRHVVEIKRMAAGPDARGFGAYLIDGWGVILDKCRELGCDVINIDVSEDGPYRLWQKLGFRVWARVPDYARAGGRRLDGYFLSVYVDEAYAALERFRRAAQRAAAGAGTDMRLSP